MYYDDVIISSDLDLHSPATAYVQAFTHNKPSILALVETDRFKRKDYRWSDEKYLKQARSL